MKTFEPVLVAALRPQLRPVFPPRSDGTLGGTRRLFAAL